MKSSIQKGFILIKFARKGFTKGFTLIELLVVVLIIGILAAIAVPQYQQAVFKGRMTQAQVILNAMHQSRVLYKLESGQEATKFDQLTLSLPQECVPSTISSSTTDAVFCRSSDIEFYIASYTSLAVLRNRTKEQGNGFHFYKLYPSGNFNCYTYGVALPRRYCKSMGYPVED